MNLMFGFLGNGLTVCDRDRLENGDYKTIAHIDPCGAVKIYVSSLSPEALAQIYRHAAKTRDGFKADFFRMSRDQALDFVYERMTAAQQLENRGLWHMSREALYALYVETVCENDSRKMPA